MLLTLRTITGADFLAQGLPESVQQLNAHRSRIQWLETLDMEPLSRGSDVASLRTVS